MVFEFGWKWWIVYSLVYSLVYSVVMGVVFGKDIDILPLFFLTFLVALAVITIVTRLFHWLEQRLTQQQVTKLGFILVCIFILITIIVAILVISS